MTKNKPVSMLEAQWFTMSDCSVHFPGIMFWQFERPTKIGGFEIEEPSGELVSLRIGHEEQLVSDRSIPFKHLVREFRKYQILSSPTAGLKIAGLYLPLIEPGTRLQLTVHNFNGRIRPFGCQVN